MSQITGAERAAGIVYRERFENAALLQRNNGLLVSGATIGIDGLTPGTGHAEIELPPMSCDDFSIVLRFTPGAAWNDSVNHYLLDTESANRTLVLFKNISNQLAAQVNGVYTCTQIGGSGTWSDEWAPGQEVTYVWRIRHSGATSDADSWLGGVQCVSSGVLWPLGYQLRKLFIGSRYNNTSQFNGTIRELIVISHGVDDEDEPVLRNGTLISDILPDRNLINLPLERDYAVSGVQSTPLEGTHKAVLDHARLGNGITATTFPTKLTNRRHGYYFDGGDWLEIADHADISVTDGVSDRAFTVALSCLTPFNTYALFAKASGLTAGEFWASFVTVGASRRIYFAAVDTANTAYLGRYNNVPDLANRRAVYIFSYDGSGLASGFRIYQDAVRIDGFDAVSGVFSDVQRSADPLEIAQGVHNRLFGDMYSFEMHNEKTFSPMQIKALTHRIENEVTQ